MECSKELLAYDELTLSVIAFKMNYSSVAYLSNQFYKLTGMTPSELKKALIRNVNLCTTSASIKLYFCKTL